MQVDMHVASVDQLTFEEFIRSIPSPTVMNVVLMDPLKGSAIMEIDPNISYAFFERLYGGEGKIQVLNRDISDIECSLTEGLAIRLLSCLRESWSNTVDLRPRLGERPGPS